MGRKQARRLGAFLAQAGIGFDAAYSSPLVRARETAGLLLGECGRVEPEKVEATEALLNETSQAGFDRLFRGVLHGHHVLLVGHAPTLAERVERLLHLPPAGGFKLGKCAMICVEWEPGQTAGALKFFVIPKLLGVKGD